VRAGLVKITEPVVLLNALNELDADDLAYIADDIPADILQQRLQSLPSKDKDWLQSSLSYTEDMVGALMGNEWVAVKETDSLEQVLQHLRGLTEFPMHNDKLFVVDRRGILKGVLSLQTLLLSNPIRKVNEVMAQDVVRFVPDDDAGEAAKAFERYDLVSAPVVNPRGKLIGRLTVDMVMDYIREESTEEVLGMAGLRGGEDLFAPVLHSARNRVLWLSINLLTAFISSRIIGIFETSISQLVALAALMPIVATVGGNTGNQTIALMIRGITSGQITPGNVRYLVRKELVIGVLNGITMGTLVGLFAYQLYGNVNLGLVITVAMLITLVLAALIGLAYPLLLQKMGRDPALGSSILLTATTDSMGFLVFLGLATVFLLH
jgi:magnesium transporter